MTGPTGGLLQLVACTVDLDRERVLRAGVERGLTTREAALLRQLVASGTRPLERDTLLREVWGYGPNVVSRAVDSTVARLREKIEADPARPDHLLTVHGCGYRLELSFGAADPVPAPPEPASVPVTVGEWTIDLARGRAVRGGHTETLSATDVALLSALLERRGVHVEREALVSRVWGHRVAAATVVAAIHRLRRKLEPDGAPPILVATRGRGYRLAVDDDDPLDPILGRGAELSALRSSFGAPGVTVLVGPGGIGKTTLARRVLEERAGLFVDLTSVDGDDAVLDAVAAALGGPGGADLPARIVRLLARRGEQVLVLDNAEQVLAGVMGLVVSLRAGCPELRVLVTSRVTPDLDGVRVIEVGPLGTGAAVALYWRHAPPPDAAAQPDVQRVVAALDGIPLAVEIAAANAAVVSPADLLARLGRHLDLAAGAGAARHTTLRACLDTSGELLSAVDRAALGACSLFRGAFDLADAERVLGDDAPTRLAALRRASLVVVTSDGERSSFVLLDTVRVWAGSYRSPEAVDRYLGWAEELALPALDDVLSRADHLAHAQRIGARVADLAHAVELAGTDPRAAVAALGVAWVALMHGPRTRGLRALDRVATDLLPSPLAARCLLYRSRLLRECDDPQAAEAALDVAERLGHAGDPLLRLSLALHRTLLYADQVHPGLDAAREAAAALVADADRPAAGLTLQGRIAAAQGDWRRAWDLHAEALAVATRQGWTRQAMIAAEQLAMLAWTRGDLVEARARFDRYLALLRELGLEVPPHTVFRMVVVTLELGELAASRRLAEEAVARAVTLGSPADEGLLEAYLAEIALLEGRLEACAAKLADARPLLEAWGSSKSRFYVDVLEARLELARDRPRRAVTLLQRSHHTAVASGHRWNAACACSVLGYAQARLGEVEAGRATAESALPVLHEVGNPSDLARAYGYLAAVAGLAGDRPAVAAHRAEAERWASTGGAAAPTTEVGQLLLGVTASGS